MKKQFLLFTLLAGLFFSCDKKQEPVDLKYFNHTWQSTDEEGNFEVWEKVNDSLYTGKNYTVKDKDTIINEYMRLHYVDGILNFSPTVMGQNNNAEVHFPLKSVANDAMSFVFENPEHDFPQQVLYNFRNDHTLVAIIMGKMKGKDLRMDFHFKQAY